MIAKLVSITPDAEEIMAYCARVSSPHQDKPEYEGLLRYCVRNQHWSVFEMANMVVEVRTSRMISPQILRHKSFSFQEFSQRYAAATGIVLYEARRQDHKNRQNSLDDLSDEVKEWWVDAQLRVAQLAYEIYQEALDLEIAKECARAVLPLNTETKLYMQGSIRSWIHYLELRTANGTQREHMEIAEAIKAIFCEQLPTVARALDWVNGRG